MNITNNIFTSIPYRHIDMFTVTALCGKCPTINSNIHFIKSPLKYIFIQTPFLKLYLASIKLENSTNTFKMRYLYHTKCYRINIINDDDDDDDDDDGRLHMYLPVNIIK